MRLLNIGHIKLRTDTGIKRGIFVQLVLRKLSKLFRFRRSVIASNFVFTPDSLLQQKFCPFPKIPCCLKVYP